MLQISVYLTSAHPNVNPSPLTQHQQHQQQQQEQQKQQNPSLQKQQANFILSQSKVINPLSLPQKPLKQHYQHQSQKQHPKAQQHHQLHESKIIDSHFDPVLSTSHQSSSFVNSQVFTVLRYFRLSLFQYFF